MSNGTLRRVIKWWRVDWLAPVAASNHMLREQYDVTIRVYACVARGGQAMSDRLRELEQTPKDQRPWSDLYEMEMLLTQLAADVQARREMVRRVAEARKRFGDEYADQYTDVVQAASPIDHLRAALLRLVNDLLWTDTKEETCRRLFACVTARACICFIICTILFLWRASTLLKLCSCAPDDSFTTCVMFCAAVTGAWGATFSMLWSTKTHPAQADLARLKVIVGFWQTIARPLVGAGCGIILYLAILGGFISGSLFPTPGALKQPAVHASADVAPKTETETERKTRETDEDRAKQEQDDSMKGLALLALWCFVAGFSERLILGVLDRAGNTSTGGPAPATKSPGS